MNPQQNNFTVPIGATYVDSITNRANAIRSITQQAAAAGHPGSWQIEQLIMKDGRQQAVISQTPSFRPNPERISLGPDFRPTRVEALEAIAIAKGRTLVELRVQAGYAMAAALTPAIITLRRSLALTLKRTYEHEVDVNATWHPAHGLDTISIHRFPQLPADAAEKGLRDWLTLVLGSPRASSGWKIDIEPLDGVVHMRYGAPDTLPSLLSLDATFPASVDPGQWSKIPLGQGPNGNLICQDLTATPHALIAGPTGSGKTVALMALCANAMLRGHKLVMLDPTKGGLDFLPLKPFAWGWATTLEDASDMIQEIYAEVTRRKAVLQELGKVNWQSCSPSERAQHNLLPITLLVDEFGSLALEIPIPKGLPKDSPLLEELTQQNAAKAMVKTFIGKIAREARFAGVFLQVALQRPDTAIMGSGELRSNLTFRTQLVPKTAAVEDTALRMLFDTEVLDSVRERILTLADGSPGLAVVASEGGAAQGVKVPYMDPELIEEALLRRGLKPCENKLMHSHVPPRNATVAHAPAPAWDQEVAPTPVWADTDDPF